MLKKKREIITQNQVFYYKIVKKLKVIFCSNYFFLDIKTLSRNNTRKSPKLSVKSSSKDSQLFINNIYCSCHSENIENKEKPFEMEIFHFSVMFFISYILNFHFLEFQIY